MKNIKIYAPEKYRTASYREVTPGVYQHGRSFCTSLSFEQEPKFGEGSSAADISQYPLEDILEQFCVHISDFYLELNKPKSSVCYVEFSGSKLECISNLLSIVGKRVYNKALYENGEEYAVLIIE